MKAMKSYLPGHWCAVIGESVTVVLPPSATSRVARVWEVVDQGGTFDAVLDEILTGGLNTLDGFGLVGLADGNARALFRGNARVLLATESGAVQVDGTGAALWSEGNAEGVEGFVIEVDSEPLGTDELLIEAGLVRVARVTSPGRAGVPAAPVDVSSVPVAAAPEQPTEPPVEQPVEQPQVQAVAQPEVQPDVQPSVLDEAFGVPAAAPEESPETELFDTPASVEPTEAWSPDFDEPSAPVAAPSPIDESTMDSAPHFGGPMAPPSPEYPVPAEHAPYAPAGDVSGQHAGSAAVARLVLSTGENYQVDRSILFGRAPVARRFQANEEPLLVSVHSPQQEISSTHLEIRPGTGADQGMAVVTDLGSTNGTVVMQPGLGPEELQAGVGVALIAGAVVDLGDGVTIQVIAP